MAEKLRLLKSWATRDNLRRIYMCRQGEDYLAKSFIRGRLEKVWENYASKRQLEQKLSIFMETTARIEKVQFRQVE